MRFSKCHLAMGLLSVSFSTCALAEFDPSCMPVVKAAEARIAQPTWQSTAVMSQSGFELDTIRVVGRSFTRISGGSWKKSPIDHSDSERSMIAQIKSGSVRLSNCKSQGMEMINGTATEVIAYSVKMAGAPAVSTKLNIGKIDGLPYLQTTATIKTTYRYQDVTAPQVP